MPAFFMRYFEGVGRIMVGWDVSYLLKFDFCAFLGDLIGDLVRPYITITGKRDLLLYARYERNYQFISSTNFRIPRRWISTMAFLPSSVSRNRTSLTQS